MNTTVGMRYRVEGMDCPSCAAKIETALGRLPGVDQVRVTYSTAALALHHDPERTSAAEIESTVAALGFEARNPGKANDNEPDGRAHGHDHGDAEDAHVPLWKTGKARVV